jgi:hypothetical protein
MNSLGSIVDIKAMKTVFPIPDDQWRIDYTNTTRHVLITWGVMLIFALAYTLLALWIQIRKGQVK